jgi:hypothetical protein
MHQRRASPPQTSCPGLIRRSSRCERRRHRCRRRPAARARDQLIARRRPRARNCAASGQAGQRLRICHGSSLHELVVRGRIPEIIRSSGKGTAKTPRGRRERLDRQPAVEEVGRTNRDQPS